MRTVHIATLASAVSLTLLVACESTSHPIAPKLQAMSFANSEWSEPVNLGPVVNSTAGEMNPALSPDGLSLYFVSNKPGGLGGTDIWVSRRACDDCAWQAPVNLGFPINTADADGAPALSTDGHLLFFFSDRPGGFGQLDIYVSRRTDTHDDFAWGPPENLGPDVNTPDGDAGAAYAQVREDGFVDLYFNRAGAPDFLEDIYVASVTPQGATRGPAVPVPELNDPGARDFHPSVRSDGKEIYFGSTRAGSLGMVDLWVSTRPNVNDAWSAPENVGPPLSTTFNDLQPALSHDGRTLVFASNRPGGSGGSDLWMSTRTPSGH
jgi:hypothetical protein